MHGRIGSDGGTRWWRRGGWAAVLLAALAACDQPQTTEPARIGQAGPSLSINPLCADSLGGLSHTEFTVTSPVTWARADNPHRVNWGIDVTGAGRVTIEPGVLVCFSSLGRLAADNGGRIVAAGRDTAVIVFTAMEPGSGWNGVVLHGDPDSASIFRNMRMEYTRSSLAAVYTYDSHPALVDSVTVRQSARAFVLMASGSRVSRSRVDTTTTSDVAAVLLGADSTHLDGVTVRGAAGTGVEVWGTAGVSLLRVRILDSGGTGLKATLPPGAIANPQPVRVTGGSSYGAELSPAVLARMYPALADQDSLLGNARDTLVIWGGTLKSWAYARHVLPWRVRGSIVVEWPGILRAQAWSSLVFEPYTGITARAGGRVLARGTGTAPVLMTARDTAQGWGGITLQGTPDEASKLTNVRVEYVVSGVAVYATDQHPVLIDSAVFRQNGVAVLLEAADSRISRTRVDTTRIDWPAVGLWSGTTLESTLIRGSAGHGLALADSTAQVLSCEVRQSARHGIYLTHAGTVHDCNLVNNAGDGIYNSISAPANVENNWWGDSGGPFGTSGDGASGTMDYTPWRTTPFVLPYVP